MTMTYDYMIIGGGIIGISTAWQLQQRQPNKKIALIEKEATLSAHQTSHNSGVIHAGVYYPPDSLKARFCHEGSQATLQFCQKHRIPHEQCGKLLVATNDLEYSRMETLYQRCQTHGLAVQWLDEGRLLQREPYIKGLSAIWVKATGIVNYQQVAQQMAKDFVNQGGTLHLRHTAREISESPHQITLQVDTPEGSKTFKTRFLISCCGLMADRVVRMMGLDTDFQIIPYRGEYYRLSARFNQKIRHLIYPIPDPSMPFLGVHLTRMIDGSVTVGPNAVQGWKREGYGRFNVSWQDTKEMLLFPGFWHVLKQHWRAGLKELNASWCKTHYLQQVQKYCEYVMIDDLHPYPAGIRAQAVSRDGRLLDDFVFSETSNSLHVCNAPSPAATSAIPIGRYICDQVLKKR